MDPGAPVREPYRAARSGERWRTAPVERPEAKQIPAELQDREGATLACTTRVERRSRRRAVGCMGCTAKVERATRGFFGKRIFWFT